MYQIKYTDGMELVVTGDLCEVRDRHGSVRFSGTHDECVRFLSDRGIRVAGSKL